MHTPQQIADLKYLADTLFTLFELSRSKMMAEAERRPLLTKLAVAIRVLQQRGFRVSLHPGVIHIYPLSHVETSPILECEGRYTYWSEPIEDFIRHVTNYLQNKVDAESRRRPCSLPRVAQAKAALNFFTSKQEEVYGNTTASASAGAA